MNFDLNQLLQGPVRDLVLNQVTKQLGVTNGDGGSLLNRGLAIILGGMTQKASSTEGIGGLFDLIQNTNIRTNPLDMLTGEADINAGNLLELGKSILPNLFGERTDTVANHLANSTNTSPVAAKGILGMLLPFVFSFFKGKIANGLGLSGFANLLTEQTRALSPYLDSSALGALGFANKSFDNVLSHVTKFGTTAAATGAAVKHTVSGSTEQAAKSSTNLSKWLIGGGVLLAALFGIKSCTEKANTTSTATPAAQTATATAGESNQVSEGLGNLAWLKTDKDLTVSGTVQNESIKTNILDAFKGLAAGLPLVDKLVVDAKADQFSFTDFAGLASLFKDFPSVNGAFADKVFNLIGEVSSVDAKTSLVEKAKALLGSVFTVNADKVAVAVAEPEAEVISDMSLSKLDLDISFATGSSEIKPRYFRRLNALAQYIIENKRTGEVAGYTDNVGDAAANQKLSEQRANALRDYLIKQGVPAEALIAVGYGQENPIADNSTEEGRTKNRRIEFNVR